MNRKEYDIAVSEYSGRIYRYALKCLKDKDDASDMVQDTYEKLWKNRKKVDFHKAKSWLFTTAHNNILNFIKKHERMKSVDFSDYKEPSQKASDEFEMRQLIDQCLNRLPQLQKSIILLRDLEGYQYKEIGEILGLSETQVKVYLFRGRQKIKEYVKDLTKIIA